MESGHDDKAGDRRDGRAKHKRGLDDGKIKRGPGEPIPRQRIGTHRGQYDMQQRSGRSDEYRVEYVPAERYPGIRHEGKQIAEIFHSGLDNKKARRKQPQLIGGFQRR